MKYKVFLGVARIIEVGQLFVINTSASASAAITPQ
jgi:hypothetical protein